MYESEVVPGTYTIRVDSVPQSQTDENGRSVHYDYPALNSRFLEFEVERVAGIQEHTIYIDHLGSVTVQKFDENGGALPGTTFKLTGKDRDGDVSEERVTNDEGKITFITTNANSSGTLVGGRNAKLKTGSHMAESRALIPNAVDHITYTLVETKTAPNSGLTLLPEQIDVTLPLVYTDAEVAATQGTDNPIDTTKGWYNESEGKWYFFDVNYKIYNDKVFAPPATGGEGNKMLGLAGIGVAGVATGAWLLMSKRKEHAE
jgi:LPXTG-motif cell wall-anchored protein